MMINTILKYLILHIPNLILCHSSLDHKKSLNSLALKKGLYLLSLEDNYLTMQKAKLICQGQQLIATTKALYVSKNHHQSHLSQPQKGWILRIHP